MRQTTPTLVPVPLAEPPQIVLLGHSVHGRADGPSTEEYCLHDLWCVHIYRYEAILELDGHTHPIHPGSASVVPPGQTMKYHFNGLSEHCFCHFRLTDADSADTIGIRAVQPLGSLSQVLYERFVRIALSLPTSSAMQQAFCWDLLWTLSTLDDSREESRHPSLQKAITLIERHFSEPISVADLAQASGVSYSYLSRLFQAELGIDVVGYIRQRRSRHAEHLLRSSTLPIKAIAASVGLPDLTQFNRLIRRTCGCSPTEVRQRNN
jgi:AraC family transcriptional regulator